VRSGQLLEQVLGLFQIERVEALGEPAVDRSEKIAGLIPLIRRAVPRTLPTAVAQRAARGLRSRARQARSCEMSLLVWSGITSVAMMLTTPQKAM
jgi:hypothetical protein